MPQRTSFSRRFRAALILLSGVTLIFGLLLIFGSSYFMDLEHKKISDAILRKSIQEIDTILSAADRMTAEFLQDDSYIGQFMFGRSNENIERYKMKRSMDRFYDSLTTRFGSAVSLYILAPRTQQIYLNGALYPIDEFSNPDWIDETMGVQARGDWSYTENASVYRSYNRFIHEDVFYHKFNYPLSSNAAYGALRIQVSEKQFERILSSSLPTEESQFYVLDQSDRLVFGVGRNYRDYLEDTVSRKDRRLWLRMPSTPSVYTVPSAYTGWQYVLRIPKSGIVSLWSPIGTLTAVLLILYCVAVSGYLFILIHRPYSLVRQTIREMTGSINGAQDIPTDEFLYLCNQYTELNRNLVQLSDQLENYRTTVCDRLISDLVNPYNILSFEDHERRLRQAGVNFFTGSFCPALLQWMDNAQIVSSQWVLDRLSQAQLPGDQIRPLCAMRGRQEVLLLLTADFSLTQESAAEYLRKCLVSLETETGSIICAGMGQVCRRREALPDSYRLARMARNFGLRQNRRGLFLADEILRTRREPGNINAVKSEYEQILAVTQENYPEKLPGMLDNLFDEMRRYNFTDSMFQLVYSEITFRSMELAQRFNLDPEAFTAVYPNGILYELERLNYGDGAKAALQKYFTMMYNKVEEQRSSAGSNTLASNILRFIEANYTNPDFSLSLLESQFSVTDAHISRIFKKSTGQTVQTYLTRLRIDKARELLIEDRRAPLNTIAEKVGYLNFQTFTRAFKKVIGVNPSDFRRSE